MSPHVTQPGAQKVHTRMVKEVLKAVARANTHPYQSVFADFIAGHPEPPRESWRLNSCVLP